MTYCGPKEILFGPCDHSSFGVSKRHLVVTGRPRSFCHPITIPLSQPHPGCGRQKAEGPLPSAFQRQAWADCSICRWARCVWGSGHRERWWPGGRSCGESSAPPLRNVDSRTAGAFRAWKSACTVAAHRAFLEGGGGEAVVGESRESGDPGVCRRSGCPVRVNGLSW